MNDPTGLAFDAVNDRLFVSAYSSGILVFDMSHGASTGMSPSYTLCSGYGLSQSTCAGLGTIAYDATNSRLFLSDNQNSRVLVFNVAPGVIANNENASYVLGQPNFTSGSCNQGGSQFVGMAANTLCYGGGLAYDATNSRLFVGDDQGRIMVFNVAPGTIANDENASYVLGQTNFTSSAGVSGTGNVSSSSGVSYDPNTGRLFVGSIYSDVVLVFNAGPSQISNGMNASYELGCTSFGVGCYGTTQSTLFNPAFLRYDPGSGRLFVPDLGNNRVMIFDGTMLGNLFPLMPD